MTPQTAARVLSTFALTADQATHFLAAWDETRFRRAPRGAVGGGQFVGSNAPEAPKLSRAAGRAWNGETIALRTRMGKLETGQLGEQLAIAYMQQIVGHKDAQSLNDVGNNFPVDLVGDHTVTEVKAGLVSNGASAQQWRATIGQPGPAETAWLARASPEAKRKWNERKASAIIERKNRAVVDVARRVGHRVRPQTISLIINPDRKIVDVYRFPGFHSRVGWSTTTAEQAYAGSYRYA